MDDEKIVRFLLLLLSVALFHFYFFEFVPLPDSPFTFLTLFHLWGKLRNWTTKDMFVDQCCKLEAYVGV